MRHFMLSAILFIVITSTAAYASPVHIELRDIASPDAPAITTKRLVRRIWPFSQPQDSSDTTAPYQLPPGLPNKIEGLGSYWRGGAVLADDTVDSQLNTVYLEQFETEIAELKKPNAVMKYIKISGAWTSKEFKLRWDKIVQELVLLTRLYGDQDFVWGHSKGLDRVYIAIRAGKNKDIVVPKVSDSKRVELPEVRQFMREHRDLNLDFSVTNWFLYRYRTHSHGGGALYI